MAGAARGTERVNSCVVGLLYRPDLNIKGGLNLTYTTLNHVTCRLIKDLPNTISEHIEFNLNLTLSIE